MIEGNRDLQLVVDNKPASLPHTENDAGRTQVDDKPFADTAIHAAIARATFGISPISLVEAYQDWLLHLLISPGQQIYIAKRAIEKIARLSDFSARCVAGGGEAERCISPQPGDRRFKHKSWQSWPFNVMHQGFLLNQQWWHNAVSNIPGVTKQHTRMLDFYSRQFLDMYSPSNFPWTNPEVIERTQETFGSNFVQGYSNYVSDVIEGWTGLKPQEDSEQFRVGHDVATTPGHVVYRNDLIELIKYEPTGEAVHPEPILITPAWIMKYYILDLSPENSLVKYLISKNFTVFVISWVNPDASMRNTSFEDYRRRGLTQAMDVVLEMTGAQQLHAVGYCLGGTLLAIEAARLARDRDERLATMTLLAAQVDFTEAGELTLFINESQVSFLEDLMQQKGYLDSNRMAGTFQLLRSQDLIWSRMVRNYLMGDVPAQNDLMAWNADATRMPYRMHSDYLRKLFLNNELAEGRFKIDGKSIYLEDIKAPTFAVATETDHVSPWHSIFKLIHLLDNDITFLMTSGGHNAGIVSELGHKGRRFRMSHHNANTAHPDRENWMNETPVQQGSWWPKWLEWLQQHSGPCDVPSEHHMSADVFKPLCAAPGTYVLMK